MPVLDGHDAAAVAEAARRVATGELVAFPTETVYGLGARADDDAAVARVYATKGRPAGHPLIVHLADADGMAAFSDAPGDAAHALAAAFWPGPLTVIVPRRPGVAGAAAGGQDSIGLRVPRHPVALRWLREAARLGVPGVAGPSANRFGRVSPTCAAHVAAELGDALCVLDGGTCDVGIESAIVDCRGRRPALLRPGAIGRAAIEAALGAPLAEAAEGAPRAPGTLAAHYRPDARLRLMQAPALKTALRELAAAAAGARAAPAIGLYSRSVAPGDAPVRHVAMADDPAAAAHDLYATLRGFDDAAIRVVWVEEPPAAPAWDGVRDRLHRAAAS
jgi:L-threonylcarbamoyladenylate synthase